jgi:hypothetical protein
MDAAIDLNICFNDSTVQAKQRVNGKDCFLIMAVR